MNELSVGEFADHKDVLTDDYTYLSHDLSDLIKALEVNDNPDPAFLNTLLAQVWDVQMHLESLENDLSALIEQYKPKDTQTWPILQKTRNSEERSVTNE